MKWHSPTCVTFGDKDKCLQNQCYKMWELFSSKYVYQSKSKERNYEFKGYQNEM